VFDFVIDFWSMDALFDSLPTTDSPPPGQKHHASMISVKQLYHLVNPGGYLITCQQSDSPVSPELKSPQLWVGGHHPTLLLFSPAVQFLGLKKRSVCCNTRAALYWGASGVDTSEQAVAHLSRERDLLEEVTVTQMVQRGGNYRKYGPQGVLIVKEDSPASASVLRMTSAGRDKAIRALQEHGFCIVRDVFPSEVCFSSWRATLIHEQTVRKWGDASLRDLEVASERLRSRKGLKGFGGCLTLLSLSQGSISRILWRDKSSTTSTSCP
jgi:hypothetical protein